MEDDDRELLRRLFVAATELSETAHEAAIAGQSSALGARNDADAGAGVTCPYQKFDSLIVA